jgi:heat shock protein HslJ
VGDSTAVVDIDWTLTELDGAPVSTAAESTPTLRLTRESGALRATGLAGCNRFRGPATLSDGELRFGPLVSTKMACPALDVETRYMRALDVVRSYRITSRQLQLLAGDRVVARFTAP